MVKVLNIVGARPNFMKMAPIIAEIGRRGSEISQILVHTGQHYDEAMSASFFRDLGMPAPDINLEVGSGTHAEQTARVMLAVEPVLVKHKPDWVVVVGDVNSTIACALVASKLGIKVAHVEAGLRSNDWSMPEEVNRVLTDRLSDLLLTPSADGDDNLAHEGIDSRKIVRVGNVMIDTLLRQRELAAKSAILHKLELQSGKYAVLTLHRPSNVDDPQALKSIFTALEEISEKIPVIFPAHPRTQVRLKEFGVGVKENISVLEPMGYIDFLQLWSHSLMVLTDSGGLQEETTALGIPCLTLRENTERPVTVTEGTNQIVGCNPDKIRAAVHAILENGRNASPTPLRRPEMWDGKAAERVVDALIQRARW
jgi:UDP-N-acetylglucosamine 2-epimerase (non-hydrolysing)